MSLDHMPRTTQAKLLRRVAAERYPKLALGSIAATWSITLADLQTLLDRNGYPDQAALLRAAALLEQPPAEDQVTDADDTNRQLLSVAVDDLQSDPDNPREELTDIDELAESIQEVGLLQPIVARRHNGRLIVVAGHRRLAAVRRLHWTHVDAIVRGDMRPDHVLAAMLVENGQRSGLDPIEEARALQKLKRSGKSDAEIARGVGRSPAWVTSRLELLQLPDEDQEEVRAGHYTLTHATDLLRAARRRKRPTSRQVGRPKGAKTKPYFGDTHPLAKDARALCDHRGTPKVGGVACGPCWEKAIRTEERAQLEFAATLGHEASAPSVPDRTEQAP